MSLANKWMRKKIPSCSNLALKRLKQRKKTQTIVLISIDFFSKQYFTFKIQYKYYIKRNGSDVNGIPMKLYKSKNMDNRVHPEQSPPEIPTISGRTVVIERL